MAGGAEAKGNGGIGDSGHAWYFNAAVSSNIYGSSSTVTPLSIACCMYMKY